MIREPVKSTSSQDMGNEEFQSLLQSNPGSICNIQEIEEDVRRQSMKAVRNELIRVLPEPTKKQKPINASKSPI